MIITKETGYNKEFRAKAVKFYLASDKSLRNTAYRFRIHYLTLYQWVKWFKAGGENNLVRYRPYRKPENRLKKTLEMELMYLKEKKPGITVRAAREALSIKGINISPKCIWGVWKRYGLAGVPHNKQTVSYDVRLFPETAEIKAELAIAKNLLGNNRIKEAAAVLNNLPYCPDTDILNKIPDRFLSLRRKIEKFPTLFWKIPFSEYRKKMKQLRERMKKNGLNYSALRAGIQEVLALQWMGKSKKMLSLINYLDKKQNNNCEPCLKTSFILLKGLAYAMLFDIKKARKQISKCNKQILDSFPFLNFDIAGVYASIGDIKKAIFFIERGLQDKPGESREIYYETLAYFYSLSGNYGKSAQYLNKINTRAGKRGLTISLIQAQLLVTQGRFEEALNLTAKILSESKKETIVAHLNAASLMQAEIFAALGDTKKTTNSIKKYIPLFEKSKAVRQVIIRCAILGKTISQNASQFSFVRLILFLRNASKSLREGDYRKAFHYASNKALLGFFYQFILFFPESVIFLLAKGKSTGLPRVLLRLPVFNKKTPVYDLKFLGHLRLYKNQKYLKTTLNPKDAAFLIHLANRVPERNQSIRVKGVCRNFWPHSKNPSRNLSHLLVRIKRALKIPGHLLEVSHRYGESVLINRGIHFITDYSEFEQTLATAHALERADEWEFAHKEYLHAFKLFRGEPFKKMYDPWSENMRRVILNKLETEAVNYAKNCLEHKNKKDAKRVLEKVLRIIPNSEEIKNLLNGVRIPTD